eukprot:1159245-Pelagomonas_calceolata.AAC.7
MVAAFAGCFEKQVQQCGTWNREVTGLPVHFPANIQQDLCAGGSQGYRLSSSQPFCHAHAPCRCISVPYLMRSEKRRRASGLAPVQDSLDLLQVAALYTVFCLIVTQEFGNRMTYSAREASYAIREDQNDEEKSWEVFYALMGGLSLAVCSNRDFQAFKFILQRENHGDELFKAYLQSLRLFVQTTWDNQEKVAQSKCDDMFLAKGQSAVLNLHLMHP